MSNIHLVNSDANATFNEVRNYRLVAGEDKLDDVSEYTTEDATVYKRTIALSIDGTKINKIYDGTTNVEDQEEGVWNFDRRVAGDDLVIDSEKAVWYYDSKNAGVRTVTLENIVLIGDDVENYEFTNDRAMATTDTATIDKRALQISIDSSKIEKMYDGTTDIEKEDQNASYSFSNDIEGDDIDLDVAGAVWKYADKNAGDNKQIIVDNMQLVGEDRDNYTWNTNVDVSNARITKRPITVYLNGSKIYKVYDGNTSVELEDQAVAWSTNKLAGDDVYLESGHWKYASTQWGTNNCTVILSNIQLAGLDVENYYLTSETSITNNASMGQAPSDAIMDSLALDEIKRSFTSTSYDLWAFDPFEFGEHFTIGTINDRSAFLFYNEQQHIQELIDNPYEALHSNQDDDVKITVSTNNASSFSNTSFEETAEDNESQETAFNVNTVITTQYNVEENNHSFALIPNHSTIPARLLRSSHGETESSLYQKMMNEKLPEELLSRISSAPHKSHVYQSEREKFYESLLN